MSGTTNRGAVPVGFVSDLPALEARAILYLRLWCDAPERQAEVWNDFAFALGTEPARKALDDLNNLIVTLTTHARRPLMRHTLGCSCVGADESAFGSFISAAAEGAREDAMLLATLMARPDMAAVLTGMAEKVAMSLMRLDRKRQPARMLQ